MANRYNFASIGGAAVDELTKLLAERKAYQQQEFLNQLRLREQALQEQQERRIADFQRQQFEDQALNRESLRVDRMYEDAMPDDLVSPDDAALYRKHGRGGALRDSGLGIAGEARLNPQDKQVDIQGEISPEQMAAFDAAMTGSVADLNPTQTRSTMAPGVIYHRGGTKALLQKQAEEARAAQARESAASRESVARENNRTREANAKLSADAKVEAAKQRSHEQELARQARQAQQADQYVATVNQRFSNSPIVKNYNDTAIKAQSVAQLVDGDWTGPADLATVFEFMKGLDPTSVVRESEYASAAASGNIFKGAFAKFNGYLSPQGGFLSPEVRQEFKRIVQMKLDVQKKAYDNLANEYGKQIERQSKLPAGEGRNMLIDYTGAFSIPQQPTQPVPSHAPTGGAPSREALQKKYGY